MNRIPCMTADTLDRIFTPDVSIITGGGTLDDRAEAIADVRSRALTYDTLTYAPLPCCRAELGDPSDRNLQL